MAILNNIETPPSLKEIAFREIKRAILSNRLETGKIYNERTLANELGISKTPVREALLDLVARGFITFLPRRGFQINTLTEKNICDLFTFRIALEKAVIIHITPGISDKSISEIEGLIEKSSKVLDQTDFLKIDREFHLYLAFLSENQYIISALVNIRDLIEWVAAKALVVKGRSEEALQEHIAIIGMLKKRDLAGAAEKMEEHLQITEKRVLSQLTPEKR